MLWWVARAAIPASYTCFSWWKLLFNTFVWQKSVCWITFENMIALFSDHYYYYYFLWVYFCSAHTQTNDAMSLHLSDSSMNSQMTRGLIYLHGIVRGTWRMPKIQKQAQAQKIQMYQSMRTHGSKHISLVHPKQRGIEHTRMTANWLIGTVKKPHKEDNHNNKKNMLFVRGCLNVVHVGFIRKLLLLLENSTNKIMKFCWLVDYFSWLHYNHSSLSLVQPGRSQNEQTSPARPNVHNICPSHLILPLMSVPLMSKPHWKYYFHIVTNGTEVVDVPESCHGNVHRSRTTHVHAHFKWDKSERTPCFCAYISLVPHLVSPVL